MRQEESKRWDSVNFVGCGIGNREKGRKIDEACFEGGDGHIGLVESRWRKVVNIGMVVNVNVRRILDNLKVK